MPVICPVLQNFHLFIRLFNFAVCTSTHLYVSVLFNKLSSSNLYPSEHWFGWLHLNAYCCKMMLLVITSCWTERTDTHTWQDDISWKTIKCFPGAYISSKRHTICETILSTKSMCRAISSLHFDFLWTGLVFFFGHGHVLVPAILTYMLF